MLRHFTFERSRYGEGTFESPENCIRRDNIDRTVSRGVFGAEQTANYFRLCFRQQCAVSEHAAGFWRGYSVFPAEHGCGFISNPPLANINKRGPQISPRLPQLGSRLCAHRIMTSLPKHSSKLWNGKNEGQQALTLTHYLAYWLKGQDCYEKDSVMRLTRQRFSCLRLPSIKTLS